MKRTLKLRVFKSFLSVYLPRHDLRFGKRSIFNFDFRRQWFYGNFLADQFFYFFDVVLFRFCDQRDRFAFLKGPSRPADAVHIIL